MEEILHKDILDKDDIISLLQTEDRLSVAAIYQHADQVRQRYCGDKVHLRGIIEISNYCEQDCLYCGLRKSNLKLQRYRMPLKNIISTAKMIYQTGIRTIVLQSGEDTELTADEIKSLITQIRNETDAAITLSLGERLYSDYELWKAAGADRYLLKHETSNSKLYSIYHQGQNLQERLDHLLFLKSIGYQIGSGNLIGLPHQTITDIADDLVVCRELDLDMASISPFISSPDTPYKNKESYPIDFILKVTAIARIVLKNVHIPATTAIGTLDEYGREKALRVGANVVMPNFTPSPFRENYQIYPNKKCLFDNPSGCKSCLTLMINSIGRTVSSERGDSIKRA